jgi:hypothetical protein
MTRQAADTTFTGPPLGDVAARRDDAHGPVGLPFLIEVTPGVASTVLEVPPEVEFLWVAASCEVTSWAPDAPNLGRFSAVLMLDGVVVDQATSEAMRAPVKPTPLELGHQADLGDGFAHTVSAGFRFWQGTNGPAVDVTAIDVSALTLRVVALGPDVPDVPVPEAGTWPTATELETHLGGQLDAGLAQRLVDAARIAVEPVVTIDPTVGPGPNVWLAALFIAADLYRAGVSLDGTYSPDGMFSVPASVSSNLVRRYSALLAPVAATGGMVG